MIERRLDADGKVVAADLAGEFRVSEDTIRRDLRELAASGRCKRVYGGALALDAVTPLADRMATDVEEKAALGRHAARHIQPGMTVFMDAGSTNLQIIRALERTMAISVVTHAPAIAAQFADFPSVDVIMIGGTVAPGVGACVDARAIQDVGMFRPDLFFMGVCGIDADGTVSAQHHGDTLFKRKVAEISKRVIAPVTRAKLNHRERYKVMDLDARALLITTTSKTPELAPYVMRGCAVETAILAH